MSRRRLCLVAGLFTILLADASLGNAGVQEGQESESLWSELEELEFAILDQGDPNEAQCQRVLELAQGLLRSRLSDQIQEDLFERVQGILSGDPRRLAQWIDAYTAQRWSSGHYEDAYERLEAEWDLPGAGAHGIRLLIRLSQYASAIGWYEDALNWAAEAEDRVSDSWKELRCEIAGRRFEAYLGMGLPDQARPFLDEERNLANSQAHDAYREWYGLTADLHHVEWCLATKRFRQAERLAESILRRPGSETLRAWGGEKNRALIEFRGAMATWELAGRDPDSRKRAQQMLDAVRQRPKLDLLDRVQVEWRLAEVWASEDADRARQYLQSAKSRLLARTKDPGMLRPAEDEAVVLSLLARLQGDSDPASQKLVQEAFAELLDRWDDLPSRKGGLGYLQYTRRRLVLDILMEQTMGSHEGDEGRRQALEFLYEAQCRGSLVRERIATGDPAGTFDQAREALTDEQQGLLVFFPGRDRGHVFAVGREEILHGWIPSARTIDPLRRGLLRECQQVLRSPEQAGSEEHGWVSTVDQLSDLLMPASFFPLLQRWSRVSVVGLDLFGELPIEWLRLADGSRLGEHAAVSRLPSLPWGLAMARAETGDPAPADVLLIAAPEMSPVVQQQWPQLPPIPFSEDQQRFLLSMFDDSRVRCLSGSSATWAGLTAAEPASARMLQVLTHGVQEPGEERPVALVFASDEERLGLVRCEDLEATRMPPRVVLAVCEATGGAPRRGDEGASPIATALFRAGARTVILSPLEVDYDAALVLLRQLNASLESGSTMAEALREATAVVAADPRFGHPAFGWFQLSGMGDERLFPDR